MAVKKKVTRSQEFSDSVIDTIREPLIALDHDLRVITASRSFYEFFKVKPEDTMGQLIYDLGNKQWDIPKLRELLETILPEKTTFDDYEVEHDFAAIGRRVLLLNARQIQRVSGKDKIILLAIEDITDRKREFQREASLESLRESDERYKAFFDSPLDLVYIFDFEGCFIDANTTTLNRLGYTREEFSSLNFASLVSEDQLPLAFKILQEIRDTGSQKDLAEYRLWHKNGSDIYVETIGSSIMSNGKPVAILGIARDITDRKQAETQQQAALAAMRESDERYRALFDRSLDLVCVFDFEGRFIDANAAALNRLGYTMKEIRSLNFASFLSKDQLPLAFKIVQEIQDTGIQKKPAEFRLRHKNGSKVHVETTGSTIISNGKSVAILSIARDITVRKVMEEMLALKNVLLSTQQEASIDGILVVDENGCILSYNRRFVELWGIPAKLVEDGVDEQVLQFVTSQMADPRSFLQRVQYLYEHRQETSQDELILADGRFFDRYSAPVIGSDKRYFGRVWYFHDITERKQAESALRQSEERYRNIIETIQDGYIEVDLAGNWTFVNDIVAGHMLYSREELTGMPFSKLQTEISAKKSFKAFNEIYKTGKPLKALEMEGLRKDGTIGNYELSISLVKDANGQPTGFRCISRDITERKKAEEALKESEKKYRLIADNMTDSIAIMDMNLRFTYVSPSIMRMRGYTPEEAMAQTLEQAMTPESLFLASSIFEEEIQREASGTAEPGRVRIIELEEYRKDMSKIWVEVSLSFLRDAQGRPTGLLSLTRDITERKRAGEEIHYLATHDVLTGLPNRLMFSQRLNFAIQTAQRYGRQFAVLFIDLDRFKIINDTLGHDAGDQLLQEIAARLKQQLRAVDVVGRLGGDEFVILIEEVSDPNHVAIIAHKILASIIKPVTLIGQNIRITASIGICMYPKDAEDEQTLMKNADIAMYQAKEEGKNNYQFYSKDIQSKSLEYLSIETNLRFAIERNELCLHYQAKVDFKTNMITGVEALLRWQNPYLGSVTPTQFIPVAEETGLIIPIGRWVLKTVCAQNAAWQRQGLPLICMSVNLSRRQLMDENLIDDIRTALDDSGMAPNLLELEITESMVMHNPELIISILTKIKRMGVRLAIDDFGTGYSSLAQIQHFPIDTLKVDRSFIRNIPKDAEDMAITEAIIAMGKTLSLTVVAEGVGTEEQMQFLKEHACDEMQGFYFSKPVVPEQFADLLRQHVPSPQK